MANAPLVVLGMDAGDPAFIEKWAAEGYLPNLASLMERGCWGKTGGKELISEHGVWISLFSGRSRGQHGYYYFRQLKPGTYDLESKTGAEIDAPPFWTLLGEQEDRRLVVIDPPDEGLREGVPGIQVVNWSTHNNWDPTHYPFDASPGEWVGTIVDAFGPKQTTLENHDSRYEEDLAIYRELLPRVQKKGALCRHLFSSAPADLYLTVFAETHAANHQFWKYCPEVSANSALSETELTYAVRDVYQAVDAEFGKILESLPSDANVVVVSSVGMADDYPFTGLSEQFFRELGYQFAPPSKPSLHPMALARKVLPESLRIALSRHLPRERREQILADQFRQGTDWSRTTAFALPSAYTAFVRVNLKGREPQGIVNGNGGYGQLLSQVEKDFFELRDPVTGECPVDRIVRSADLFGGGPPEVLPDLFVEWKEGRFLKEVVHPKATIRQERPDFYRRSDHNAHGFFAAAGPGIAARGGLEEIEVLDLAPTFMALMGEAAPGSMPGSPLSACSR